MSGRRQYSFQSRMQPAIDAITAYTTRLAAMTNKNSQNFADRVEALEAALHELRKVDAATTGGLAI